MNKLLDSTSLLVLSLDTCLIVCNTQKNRRLEVNYIVAGLWSIFSSRLLSEGNPVLCQLILRIRNSARFSVMSTSIHRYVCLSTTLTDGPLKITGRGAKNYLCRNFFSFVQVVCRIFFLGFQDGKRLSWRVACLEELHKLHIFFWYICLSVKKQLLVNIRHCL